MSDLPVPVAPEVIRKRSRSSSPGADSPAAAKKPNTDSATPSVPSAPIDPSAEPTPMQTDAEAAEVKTEEPAAMLLDSSLPAVPAADGVPAPLSAEAIAAAEAAAAAAAVIQMRALIVTQDASIIIGKQGKNVNEIREKSGSKITISEAVPGNPERVMVVAGQLDAVSKVRRPASQTHADLARRLVWSCAGSTTSRSTCPQYLARALSPSGQSHCALHRRSAHDAQIHHSQFSDGLSHRQVGEQDQGDPGSVGSASPGKRGHAAWQY